MATTQVTNPSLLDLASRTGPDGKVMQVVELLNEVSEILPDITFQEGNLTEGNKTSVRTGLPTPTWRKMYGGVNPGKSTTAIVTDTCGMLEAFAEIDFALANLGGNAAAFRLSEDRAHIEGIDQEFTETLFYGNESTEPEAFTGLAPRYNDLSAANADNIIDAGGTGSDNRSIWFVCWSPETVFGIVPKGSTAGLQHQDMGTDVVDAADGGRMVIYRSHFRMDAGLTVKDWRYVVRIANIDKSDLSLVYTAGAFASGAHLPNLMFQAMQRVPYLSGKRCAFYMSRDLLTTVQQQASAATQGSTLTSTNVGGEIVTSFHGVPIRRVDKLATDETRVV